MWMFDNLGLGNASRMLIVALNESARTALSAPAHLGLPREDLAGRWRTCER